MNHMKSHLKKWGIVLVVSIIPSFLILNMAQSHAAGSEAIQKGMSFAAWWPGLYSSPDADQALAELREDGADWLSLIVTRYQDTITSTTIYAAPGTPTDEDTDASSLAVWANDDNDQQLRTRPVEDCRYTESQPITHGTWTRVRIPLKDLNANNRLLQRVSIGNGSDQSFTFYVDEVRLARALWKTFLPLILKS